jgi:hypothetical protein
MTQGRATYSSVASTKQEPVSKAVNVEAVSEMGQQVIRHSTAKLYEGRGLEAPMKDCTCHPAGSQGKHK